MANNIQITAGSGTTVVTDDVAGVHYQVVKLATGADDTANWLSKTYPLYSSQVQVADVIVQRVSDTAGNAAAASSFGATASVKNCISAFMAYNSSNTDGYVDLTDGSGGTIFATFPLPAKGGVAMTFNPPIVQPTANTALYYDVSAAISTVYLTFVGYKA